MVEFIVANAGDPLKHDTLAQPTGSTNWLLQNVSIHADAVSISGSMMQSYSAHILNGKSLTLPIRSYTNVVFTNNASSCLLQVPRTFSKLNQVLVSFHRDIKHDEQSQVMSFYAPPDSFEAQIQIGSYKLPRSNYAGLKEMFCRCLKGYGTMFSATHATGVHEYTWNR